MKHLLTFLTVSLCILCLAGPMNARAASCPIGCDLCTAKSSCARCDFCIAVTATARPRQDAAIRPPVTAKPVPVSTPAATKAPAAAATSRPAVTPKPASTQQPSSSNADYTTLSIAKQEEIALKLLNQDRQRNGLPALTLDPALSRIARIKSQDMKDNNYFAHESPTYGRAAQMLTHFGYAFNGVGENIAHHSTVEKAEAAFMSSWGHRINILGKQWTKVGIGIVFDRQGFVYVTQLFVR